MHSRLCGNCFSLYPSKLWSHLSTSEELLDAAYRWRLTLEKRGCERMLAAGAHGIAQAMVLSFGALKFSHQHLEFDTHPNELHRSVSFLMIRFQRHKYTCCLFRRDYFFQGIAFNNATRANIWVEVGTDNKASLFVSVNHSGRGPKRQFFACDAACLDSPVELGSDGLAWTGLELLFFYAPVNFSEDRIQFPVKLTNPVTPILYIAADKQHLEDLKHTIHVKEVAEGKKCSAVKPYRYQSSKCVQLLRTNTT